MSFEDDYDDLQEDSKPGKTGLKKVSAQKSMFDGKPKKPSQEDFNKNVQKVQEKASGYKLKAAELVIQFNKLMADKTLKSNKNVFTAELEKEVLGKMIQLAVDINADPNEQEGMGSLSWITLLLKHTFNQKDRMNDLEFALYECKKNIDQLKKELAGLKNQFDEVDKSKSGD